MNFTHSFTHSLAVGQAATSPDTVASRAPMELTSLSFYEFLFLTVVSTIIVKGEINAALLFSSSH